MHNDLPQQSIFQEIIRHRWPLGQGVHHGSMYYKFLYDDQPDQYPWAKRRTASEESQWILEFVQKENSSSSTHNQTALFQHFSNHHKLGQEQDDHCYHGRRTVLLLILQATKFENNMVSPQPMPVQNMLACQGRGDIIKIHNSAN